MTFNGDAVDGPDIASYGERILRSLVLTFQGPIKYIYDGGSIGFYPPWYGRLPVL